MTNFKEHKNKSIALAAGDVAVLMHNGLIHEADAISTELSEIYALKNSGYFNDQYDYTEESEPLHIRILNTIKSKDKSGFMDFFDSNKPTAEKIWNSGKDAAAIIDALCREAILKISFEPKLSDFLFEKANLIQSDIPYGRMKFAHDLPKSATEREDITSLSDYRDLLSHAIYIGDSETDKFGDYLTTIGMPDNALKTRFRNYYNIVFNKMFMEAKSGYIANVTDYGCFYFPINPYGFTDQRAGVYHGKLVNMDDYTYPDATDADQVSDGKKVIDETNQQYRKSVATSADGELWDITMNNLDVKNIMNEIVGSYMISANLLSSKYFFAIDMIIPDSTGKLHSFVMPNIDLLHFLSCITKVSSSSTLKMKASTKTGEILITSDIGISNLEDKKTFPFIILNANKADNDSYLDNYITVDFRSFTVSESMRERERSSKKLYDFKSALKNITLALKPKEEQELAAKPEKRFESEEYTSFVNRCVQYIASYTELEQCKDKDAVCRIPKTTHYRKDADGNDILVDGKKVVDFNYIYSIREAFWINNPEFVVEELIAYFVSRGNSNKFRELSRMILGVDCYENEDILVDDLIKAGLLCVEHIEINYQTKSTKSLKYSYYADYAKGDYYEKMAKLIGNSAYDNYSKAQSEITPFSTAIIDYFGLEFGNIIIGKQQELLNREKNRPMSLLVENEKEDFAYQLEVGADNEELWTEPELMTNNTISSGRKNPRLRFLSRSKILEPFFNEINRNRKSYASLVEFQSNPEELFDACVVPMDDLSYIETYILPNWTVKTVGADGRETQASNPIVLPRYSYWTSGKNPKKRDRVVRFTRSGLMLWDGDSFYKKDMRPETGETVAYTVPRAANESTLEYFKFNDSEEGKKAAEEWKKITEELIKSAIDPYNKRKSKATRICNAVFKEYLKNKLAVNYRNKLENLWNKKYNSYILPKEIRYPVFTEHSKYFGSKKENFTFKDTQIEGMKSFVANDNSILLAHEVGFGKGNLLTSSILTPSGYVKMGTIKVGDDVISREGTATKVTGVFPLGKIDCYKVTFNDGSFTEVSKDHLWKVQDINKRVKYKSKWDVIETEELLKRGLFNVRNDYKYSIPMVQPVQFKEQVLPIHPYLLGVLLGDGSIASKNISVCLSVDKKEIWDKILPMLPNGTCFAAKKDVRSNGVSYRIKAGIGYNTLTNALKSLDLFGTRCYNKFIPEIYKFNNVENRLNVLRGILDTDGTIQKTKRNGNSTIYCTTSHQLAQDVRFLVESLGGTVVINTKVPNFTYRGESRIGKLAYLVTIRLPQDIIPFSLSKKVASHIPKTKYLPIRFIESIEFIGQHEAQCISVDHPEKLYVCENFIVTHNTSSSIGAMSNLLNTGEASRILLCVPNIVYNKWKEEIKGNEKFRGLLSKANIVDLGNATDGMIERLKDFSDNEKAVRASFKLFVKDFELHLKRKPNKLLDMDKSHASDIITILSKFIPDYSLYPSLVDFQEELETAFILGLDDWNEFKNKTHTKYYTQKNGLNQEKYDEALLKNKINYDKILTKYVNGVINFKKLSLIDELGVYKPVVMRPNSIVLCTHEAMSRLRTNTISSIEALAIIDDAFTEIRSDWRERAAMKMGAKDKMKLKRAYQTSYIGSPSTRNLGRYDVFRLPIELAKLNVDALIVDEIHDFNNIVTRARKRFIGNTQGKKDENFVYEKASVGVRSTADKAILQYYTKNSGSRTIMSVNMLAVARHIQTTNYKQHKKNNTMLLSATPFTDSPLFEMISVLAILNYERLLKANISGVYDILNQYADEEWKLDLTHDKRIGIFPTIDRYKNIYSNSNLLNMFVNFKISDAQIEELRPVKYVLPENDKNKIQILATQYGITETINSYVPMNQYQLEAKELVIKFLHDEIKYRDLFTKDAELAKEDAPTAEESANDVIEVASEEEMLNLLGAEQGQRVKRLDKGTYWILQGVPATEYGNWFELGKELEEEDDVIVEVGEDEDDEAGDVNRNAGNAEEAIDKGTLTDEDMKRAKTIVSMTADENISASPYMSEIVTSLPPLRKIDKGKVVMIPENFVENSPKLLYIAGCIKTVLDYHAERNESPSSQIVYIDRQSFYYDTYKHYPLDLFKEYLVNRTDINIKASEIAVITGSVTRGRRREIAAAFNRGEYKVLLGTSAIKQGIDLQVNTSVMYIAQADYVPSTIMQVEGRGWRQGNEWENIRIVYVLTYGSLDGFKLSKVNKKINEIKKMLDNRNKMFNMNQTQFDKDFDAMKLELETDLKRKAKLIYELEEVETREQFNIYNTKYQVFEQIRDTIGTYKPLWESFIGRLNMLGHGLQNIALEEAREAYVKVKRTIMRAEQAGEQRKAIEIKDAEIEKQNKQHLDKLNAELAAKQDELKNFPADAKDADKEAKEASKEAKKVIKEQIEELEKQTHKPLINKGRRDELVREMTIEMQIRFEEQRESITVTDQEVIDYLDRNATKSDLEGKRCLVINPMDDGTNWRGEIKSSADGLFEILISKEKPKREFDAEIDEWEKSRKSTVGFAPQYSASYPSRYIEQTIEGMSRDKFVVEGDTVEVNKTVDKGSLLEKTTTEQGVITTILHYDDKVYLKLANEAELSISYDDLTKVIAQKADTTPASATDASIQGSAKQKSQELQNLFNQSGSNSQQVNLKYVHRELEPTSSFSQVGDVVNAIKEASQLALRAENNQQVLGEETKKRYERYWDLFKSAGYYKGLDMREQQSETQGNDPRYATSAHGAFLTDVDSFRFDTKKGSILRSYYANMTEEADIQTIIEEAASKRQEFADKLQKRDDIIAEIEQREIEKQATKTAAGAYDTEKQIEKFDKTNVLLKRKNRKV